MVRLFKIAGSAWLALAVCTGVAHAYSGAEQRNIDRATQFFDDTFNNLDMASVKPYVAPYYIEHDPNTDGTLAGLDAQLKKEHGQPGHGHAKIVRTFADGDYVILHTIVRVQPQDPGLITTEIYRFDDGNIAEHWHVEEPVFDSKTNPNPISQY